VPTSQRSELLTGVIEGFYGQPWSSAERSELLEWMSQWGLNTYVYAPKDDLKQRALWRELYSDSEAQALGALIRDCTAKQIRYIYALSPGLDIRYTDEGELRVIEARCDQILFHGGRDFACLFDDISDHLSPQVLARWGSLASAQCHIANSLRRHLLTCTPTGRFLFCPTPYCGRMARAGLGGPDYLETVGRELAPTFDVFWTGPRDYFRNEYRRTCSRAATPPSPQPVIWDNLHANDYDGRRFYCGPYAGRPLELRDEVRGLLANPNCEFPLNFVPLRTLSRFIRGADPWDERSEFHAALREWLHRFATVTEPQIRYEDLVLLADCFYLPHHEGPGAEALVQAAVSCVKSGFRPAHAADEFRSASLRLRQTCARLTELRNRPLFYALSRRVWDLREELDLLDRFTQYRTQDSNAQDSFASDFHLPGTSRGGIVARLQRLLRQEPDGSWTARPCAPTHLPPSGTLQPRTIGNEPPPPQS